MEIVRRESKSDEEALARLQSFVGIMIDARSRGTWLPQPQDEGVWLAGIVVLASVERFLPKGSPRKERTSLLVRLSGGSAIRYLNLRGTIARLDLAGITFERCRFERIGWVGCLLNEGTAFVNCQFVGGVPPVQCDGFGSVLLSGTTLDPEAEAILNSARVHEGRKKYSSDDLKHDMQSVIDKFIIRGGLGLKSVEESNLVRGSISASRYKDEIIETLQSIVLEEHHISGASVGYNVRKDAADAVKFYAANNVFTGKLREAFEKLERKLGLAN